MNGLVVLFYLPVALGSVLFLFWSGGEFALWVRTLGEHHLRDVAAGGAAGVGLVAASRLYARLPAGRRMSRSLARMIGSPSLGACMLLAVASAVGEELLFRGVLQPRVGLWAATALFAVAHPPFERDLWAWPLLAVPMGLVFGSLYEWTGAVLASAVAHAVLNFANLVWLGRVRAVGDREPRP